MTTGHVILLVGVEAALIIALMTIFNFFNSASLFQIIENQQAIIEILNSTSVHNELAKCQEAARMCVDMVNNP